jgi:hypothetical protein
MLLHFPNPLVVGKFTSLNNQTKLLSSLTYPLPLQAHILLSFEKVMALQFEGRRFCLLFLTSVHHPYSSPKGFIRGGASFHEVE